MRIYKHQHSTFLWCQFEVNGRRVRRSTHETDPDRARSYAEKLREEERKIVQASDRNTVLDELVNRACELHKQHPSPDSRPDLMTAEETAQRLGVSVKWVKRSGIPTLVFGPRTIRYSRWLLDLWISLQRDPAPTSEFDLSWLALRETAPTDGFVYFIESGEDGPVKIGFTEDPMRRFATLSTAHHEKLKCFAIIHGGPSVESNFHDTFHTLRVRGEWFSPGWRVRNALCQPAFLRRMLPIARLTIG